MVTLTWYLATSVSADEREDLSVAATEVIADFEGNWRVDERYVVVDDLSRPLPCCGEWVFARGTSRQSGSPRLRGPVTDARSRG